MMSSAKRHDGVEGEGKGTAYAGAHVQLIAFARILARQAAREAIAAKCAPQSSLEQENDRDGHG